LGKSLVYAEWKGRKYVREYVTPANPNSLAQQFQRGFFGALSKWWSQATPTDRSTWQAIADANEYSTFNAYCSTNLDAETSNEFPSLTTDGTGGPASGDPASITAVPGVNRLVISAVNQASTTANDLLLITLGTLGGAAGTAHTIQRTVTGAPNQLADSTLIATVENLPAGSYRVSCAYLGPDGTPGAWVDGSTAYVVTGV
jgi:hypothetical protein